MEFVFLFTDVILFAIVILLAFFAYNANKNIILKEKWSLVFQSPTACGCLVVIIFYLIIGLLDSIHFKTNNQNNNSEKIFSALDYLIKPATEYEKTYSKPLAYNELNKKFLPDGSYNYPLLNNSKNIKNNNDNLKKISTIFVKTLATFLLFFIVSYLFIRKKIQHKKNIKIAYYTFLFLLFFILLVTFSLGETHIFGTDKVGVDIFYKTIKSVRSALLIGLITTFIILPIGIITGLLAGYFKGLVDDIIYFIYSTLNSIPGILLIIALMLNLQNFMNNNLEAFSSNEVRLDLRLLLLCAVLGLSSWTGLCRLIRSETLKISNLEYIKSAEVFGINKFKIIISYIMPNLMHIILITIVLDFSGLVLAEAILSYIGIGLDPSSISWGNMINSSRLELAREPIIWWPILFTFIFMFSLVLAVNLIGDRIRAVFNVRNEIKDVRS